MRLVVQRVKNSNVVVEGQTIGEIGQGYMVLIGVGPEDTKEIADFLVLILWHYFLIQILNMYALYLEYLTIITHS